MPISKDDITIVLPTLNEEEAIGQIIYELKQCGYHNILVVDGYSVDGTTKVAEASGGIVVFQHSQGKCGAIKTAIENVKTPYIVVMDGDYTYDPKNIETFTAHCEKYDQIIGVRTNGRRNIPKLNQFGNQLITKTFNVLLGTNLTDVCSGMYMMRSEAARDLELNTTGFDVEVEIAAQTATRGKITEVPIDYRKRLGCQKLSSWRHGFQIMRTIFRLARRYNPTALFSAIVASAIVPAVIILGWVALQALLLGIWHGGYALVGLMLLVLASNGLTVGAVSTQLKRTEKRIREQIRNNSHDQAG